MLPVETEINQKEMDTRWISVSHGMPPVNKRTLVWHKSWGVEISIIDETGRLPIGLSRDYATHWMPLPANPPHRASY